MFNHVGISMFQVRCKKKYVSRTFNCVCVLAYFPTQIIYPRRSLSTVEKTGLSQECYRIKIFMNMFVAVYCWQVNMLKHVGSYTALKWS